MIPAGPFQICSKIRHDYCSSRCTAGINDTGGKLTTGVNNTSGHIFPEIYIGHGDTGGKFATGVKDTMWSTHRNRKHTP